MSAQNAVLMRPYEGPAYRLADKDLCPPVGEAIWDKFQHGGFVDEDDDVEMFERKREWYLQQYLNRTTTLLLPNAGRYAGKPVTWIPGHIVGLDEYGPYPVECAVVGKRPGPDEAAAQRYWNGEAGALLQRLLRKHGLDLREMYGTHMHKFAMPYPNMKTVPAAWGKEGAFFLHQELLLVNPKFLLICGTDALKAILGKKAKIKSLYGQILEVPWMPNVRAVVTSNASDILRNPDRLGELEGGVRLFAELVTGKPLQDGVKTDYRYVWTLEELEVEIDRLMPFTEFAMDVETTGLSYMRDELLTIQLSWAPGRALVVCLRSKVSGREFDPTPAKAVQALRRLLCRPEVSVSGHNFKFDLKWLIDVGLDLTAQFVDNGFDTILASHLLSESGDHDLSSCTLQMTSMGRYDAEMESWLGKGFKHWTVPEEVLHVYGAGDADASLRLYTKYRELLWAQHCEWCAEHGEDPYEAIRSPVSEKGWCPTLWNLFKFVVLPVNRAITEMEMEGICIDRDQLIDMIHKFEVKRDEILAKLRQAVCNPEFNPRSAKQCQELLFGDPNRMDEDGRQMYCLGLRPIKSTGKRGKLWPVLEERGDVWYEDGFGWKSDQYAPSTDSESLAILAEDQNSHEAQLLRNFRFIDQICKNFLRGEEEDELTGDVDYYSGLVGLTDDDGRLRTTFSQLTETGRWRSSKPNCFSGDTLVLTEIGWVRFDELRARMPLKLAQYDTRSGRIDFVNPLGFISQEDDLLSISTTEHLDLCVTPDHRCLLQHRRSGKFKTVPAAEFPEGWKQLHAGQFIGGTVELTQWKIVLIAAMRTGGSISKDGRPAWKLKAPKRINRIENALRALGEQYDTEKFASGAKGIYLWDSPLARELNEWRYLGNKLFELSADTLKALADEIFTWNGDVEKRSKYSTRDKEDAEWVQILCVLTGRRATIRRVVTDGGSVRWKVYASARPFSTTRGREIRPIGRGMTYCVSMPVGTVIVSRNGRACITNQCQNIPKGREGDLSAIFREDEKVPPIRSGIVAPPGHVLIEADFKSAESHTLAWLAGDEVMKEDLAQVDENGNEMSVHSVTAVNIFKLPMTVSEFEKARKKDKRLAGLRVAAKSVNFGIPYQRSGSAIARQVMREGVECTEEDGNRWVEEWYARYEKNAEFINACKEAVFNPGYIRTPYGRMRRFIPTRYNDVNAAMQREACNFPIQSVVADSLSLGLVYLQRERDLLGLSARIVLAVHDAVVMYVPYEEVREVMRLLQYCMSDKLAVPGVGLHYEIDTEICVRWGEAAPPEILEKCGLSA